MGDQSDLGVSAGRVTQMILDLPEDAQLRVAVTANILRELLEADESEAGEIMLAFTLVMAEVADATNEGDADEEGPTILLG